MVTVAPESRDADVVLSIVIPTHNRADVLSGTLQGLAGQSVTVPWEVIVVNNRCEDETDRVVAAMATTFPCDLRLVHEDVPGASAARNHGVRSARGSVLVLLDDDIFLRDGQLARALADHQRRPDAWFIAQIVPLPQHLSTPFGTFRSAAMSVPPQADPVRQVDAFASGFAVVPRASLLDVGGYDEGYSTAALEDADLFIRARRRGIVVCYDRELIGTHNDWAGTTLRDFCQRQRVHCRTAPLLKQRFGDEDHPWSALIAANSGPDVRVEGAHTVVRKLAKSLLGCPPLLAALFWCAELLERMPRSRRLLWSVYRSAIAASMYRGYQEGVHQMPKDSRPDPKNA